MALIRRLAKPILVLVALLSSLAVWGLWQSQQVQVLSIQSASMAPLLEKGDAVAVRQVDPESLRAGDLVSMAHSDGSGVLITHRVLWIDAETGRMVTKGDANTKADAMTTTATVVGRVQYRLADAGYIIDALRSWQGVTVAVYVPMALIAGSELRRFVRYYSRPSYELYCRSSRNLMVK